MKLRMNLKKELKKGEAIKPLPFSKHFDYQLFTAKLLI